MAAYTAPSSQADAEMFYRHYLGKAGWVDITSAESLMPGLIFRKEGCQLNVAFSPSTAPSAADKEDLQVSLNFSGNYDVRWLPKFSATDSKSVYESFSSSSYRTKAELTDVEVALLKNFHEAGWTGYTRLASSSNENPNSRTFYMLQGGSELTVSIGYPADSTVELYVQTSVSVSNKSLPIPPDAGWIEFDSSTNLQLVVNTKMDLNKSVEYFDTEMTAEGWLTREVGRTIDLKERKAWLAYIRGQQDVHVSLVSLPDGTTRVIVGEAERSSWQLAKPPKVDPDNEKNGMEAADFPIVDGAGSIKFDVDQKQIHFELPGVLPPALADQYAKRLESLDWKREKSGVVSDEYTLASYKKGKAELQLRARLVDNKNSSVIISGDGMLWAKPLPAPPVRVSYGTWLRRDRRNATLDLLDEFADEMKKIPATSGDSK